MTTYTGEFYLGIHTYYIQLRNRQLNITQQQVSNYRNGRSEKSIPAQRSYSSAKIYYNLQQRELGKVSNWNLQYHCQKI